MIPLGWVGGGNVIGLGWWSAGGGFCVIAGCVVGRGEGRARLVPLGNDVVGLGGGRARLVPLGKPM